ncbi:chemotaxis protein MotB [Amorphus suaedae]
MGPADHQELIIIRRIEEDEHEHHSSAWKVAHADFMTAMMAFFLIMWLINATDDEVRKMVAAYFNPVDLAASVTNTKGLHDPEDAGLVTPENNPGRGEGEGGGEHAPEPSDATQAAREQAAFQDPYSILAKLAAEAEPNQSSDIDVPEGEAGDPGETGGDILRDPFDPVYWQTDASRPSVAEAPGKAGTEASSPTAALPDARAARPDGTAAELMASAIENAAAIAEAEQAAAEQSDRALALSGAAEILPAGEGADADPQAVTSLARELGTALDDTGTAGGKPHLAVQQTAEGLLVSLTDDIDFAMFPVGSAVPDPKVVKAMETIARALQHRDGDIVIRGYTDARPFRSETYDNWRLSSARAHMARYMLVRGGLDEGRIVSVEGHADRDLKDPQDPNAPENRRIVILLREPAKGTRP